MTITVIDLITDSLRLINVIDANEAPSAEQGIQSLHVLNELMADAQADGIAISWYPIADADIATTAPLQDQDIRAVKSCLAVELSPHFGIEPLPQLKENAEDAYTKLVKRYVRYMESDTTFLPQGESFWGPYGTWGQ